MSDRNLGYWALISKRLPCTGDLIIKRSRSGKQEGMGLVVEHCDSSVKIHWHGPPPRDYNQTYGYPPTNIHNLRDEFVIIRDGVEIL